LKRRAKQHTSAKMHNLDQRSSKLFMIVYTSVLCKNALKCRLNLRVKLNKNQLKPCNFRTYSTKFKVGINIAINYMHTYRSKMYRKLIEKEESGCVFES